MSPHTRLESFARRITRLPHRRITRLPHRRIARLPHRRITRLPHRRIARPAFVADFGVLPQPDLDDIRDSNTRPRSADIHPSSSCTLPDVSDSEISPLPDSRDEGAEQAGGVSEENFVHLVRRCGCGFVDPSGTLMVVVVWFCSALGCVPSHRCVQVSLLDIRLGVKTVKKERVGWASSVGMMDGVRSC